MKFNRKTVQAFTNGFDTKRLGTGYWVRLEKLTNTEAVMILI